MTKILRLILVLTVLFTVDCKAQHLVGFQGYYGMSTVSCDSSQLKKNVATEPSFGFGVGYKHLELRNMIGFQGEINYQYSGFSINTVSTYYTQHLKYISVPLLAHVDFGKHVVKFTFSVGTYANFLIDKTAAETNIELIDSSHVARIENGKYKTFSYGLTGQVGFSFCTKAGVFTIHGRGYVGMSKMVDMGDIALFNYMSERSFGVGLSWMKPFGKGDPYYTKKEKVKKLEEEDPLEIETVPENSENQESELKAETEEEKVDTNQPTNQDFDWEGERYENDAKVPENKEDKISEEVESEK